MCQLLSRYSIGLIILLGVVIVVVGARNVPCQVKVGGAHGIRPTPTVKGIDDGYSTPPRAQDLIEPGSRVGPLQLGDTHAHILQVLPFKANEDQEWEDDCGTTLNWVDKSGKRGIGNVTIKFKDQRAFQIESGTPRFRTVKGLAIYDSPEKVRRYYTDLRAYVLLDAPIRAFGDRPLIFWLNNKRGIAFAFVYNPEEQRRYLYRIIVFRPNAEFCPEDETTDSPDWRELPPYSLEPPDTIGTVPARI